MGDWGDPAGDVCFTILEAVSLTVSKAKNTASRRMGRVGSGCG